MDAELLSLKWNNHKNTFLGIIKVLRNKASYSDATLACEGKFYQVHKMVLSVCSDYFADIFENTSCKNPVIVLRDIDYKSLEFLLDYMYLGEVNVKQAELSTLIKAAEYLHIKGLAAPDEEVEGCENNKTMVADSYSPPPKRRKNRHSQNLPCKEQPHQEISTITVEDPIEIPIKSEPVECRDIEDTSSKKIEKYEDTLSITKEEIEAFPFDPSASGIENVHTETWQDYSFDEDNTNFDPPTKDDTSMENTWLTVNVLKKKCTFCDYSSTSAANLRRHERIHRGEVRLCPYCPYLSSDYSTLKRHKINKHGKECLKDERK